MTYEKANEYALFMPEMKYMDVIVKQLERYDDKSWYATYAPNQHWVERMVSSLEYERKIQVDWDIELAEAMKKDAQTPPSGRSQKQHNLISQFNKKGKKCHF